MRERQRREQINHHIESYAAQLAPEQAATLLEAKKLLTRFASGYSLMWQLCHMIEARACKHDRIQVLIDNAAAEKQRADDAEAYNRELEATYKGRIAKLQAEIKVLQVLESTIHGIGTRQLERKAEQDPIELPEIDGENEEDRDEEDE
jgi:hypothetical protein